MTVEAVNRATTRLNMAIANPVPIVRNHQSDPKGAAIPMTAAAPIMSRDIIGSLPQNQPPRAIPHNVVAHISPNPLIKMESKLPIHKMAGSKTNPRGIKNAARLSPNADQLVAITGALPTAAAANDAKATGGVIIDSTQ